MANGTSSNYACQNWCDSNYHSSYLSPVNSQLEVGETTTFNVYQQDYDHYGILTGYYMRIQILHGSTYWSSNTTSVATINSSSALASAVAPGTTTLTATWQDYTAPIGTMCEPAFAEGSQKPDESAKADGELPPTKFGPGDPCDACLSYTVFPSPSVALAVKSPKVTFSEIGSIEQGGRKSITATLSDRGNYQITLFLMKSNNQSTDGITFDDGSSSKVLPNTNGNHSVTIKGLTRSGQLDDYKIEARYGNNNFYLAGLKAFTISGLDFVEAAACSGFDEVTVSSVLSTYILVPKSGNNTLKAVILPSGATGNFKFEVASQPSNNVTVSPTTVSTNNQVVTVSGGNTTGNFKINVFANQQNSTVSKELNVYVRNRIDKTLIFYAVTEDGSPDTPPPASNVPTASGLQNYLNEVWGRQANIYFTVTKGTDFEVDYDLDSDGRIDSSSPPEVEAVINGQNDGSNDFNLYFLGLRVKTLPNGNTPAAFSSVVSKVGLIGHVYNGTRDYITAHEIGHLLGATHTTDMTFLMYESDNLASPCKIGKREWDIVNQ